MKTTANIAGIKPAITGRLLLQSGTIVLSDRDFMAGSIKFRGGTSESSEFSVGAAIIGGLDFTLINDAKKFSGLDWFDSKVQISLEISGEVVDMGTYYVVKHYERGNVVTVECHDALKILDEYQIYEDDITWPADSAAVASKIASRHGLSVSGLTSGIQIPDPGNDLMTERECIAYIGRYTANTYAHTIRSYLSSGTTLLTYMTQVPHFPTTCAPMTSRSQASRCLQPTGHRPRRAARAATCSA